MTNITSVKKKKRIAILGVLALIAIAALCFVLGFGIGEGWEAVGAWFTSKWATLTIIAVAFVVIALIFGYFFAKDREDFR